VTNLASTMVTLMANSPLLHAADLTSLRLLSCGGSPQSPAVVDAAVAAFGCEVFLSYGMTETCGKISMSILPRAPPSGAPPRAERAPEGGGEAAAAARQAGRDAAWRRVLAAHGGAGGLMALVHTSGRPFLPIEVRLQALGLSALLVAHMAAPPAPTHASPAGLCHPALLQASPPPPPCPSPRQQRCAS
jgi:acyl-CoA synthetase (AMP-forming)/AMP-acid ligase II